MGLLWVFLCLQLLHQLPHNSAVPINRQVGLSENIYITSRNDTYGNEQKVCVIDDVLYHDGDSIPTTSPCEHCICRPPGFACTIINCEIKSGCKAIKRSNQCCPEYKCECERSGQIYQNGEKITDPDTPCEVCYCQGGEVICAVIECYWRDDCEPRYVPGRCCPNYDHCPPLKPLHPGRPTPRPTTTTTTTTTTTPSSTTSIVPSTTTTTTTTTTAVAITSELSSSAEVLTSEAPRITTASQAPQEQDQEHLTSQEPDEGATRQPLPLQEHITSQVPVSEIVTIAEQMSMEPVDDETTERATSTGDLSTQEAITAKQEPSTTEPSDIDHTILQEIVQDLTSGQLSEAITSQQPEFLVIQVTEEEQKSEGEDTSDVYPTLSSSEATDTRLGDVQELEHTSVSAESESSTNQAFHQLEEITSTTQDSSPKQEQLTTSLPLKDDEEPQQHEETMPPASMTQSPDEIELPQQLHQQTPQQTDVETPEASSENYYPPSQDVPEQELIQELTHGVEKDTQSEAEDIPKETEGNEDIYQLKSQIPQDVAQSSNELPLDDQQHLDEDEHTRVKTHIQQENIQESEVEDNVSQDIQEQKYEEGIAEDLKTNIADAAHQDIESAQQLPADKQQIDLETQEQGNILSDISGVHTESDSQEPVNEEVQLKETIPELSQEHSQVSPEINISEDELGKTEISQVQEQDGQESLPADYNLYTQETTETQEATSHQQEQQELLQKEQDVRGEEIKDAQNLDSTEQDITLRNEPTEQYVPVETTVRVSLSEDSEYTHGTGENQFDLTKIATESSSTTPYQTTDGGELQSEVTYSQREEQNTELQQTERSPEEEQTRTQSDAEILPTQQSELIPETNESLMLRHGGFPQDDDESEEYLNANDAKFTQQPTTVQSDTENYNRLDVSTISENEEELVDPTTISAQQTTDSYKDEETTQPSQSTNKDDLSATQEPNVDNQTEELLFRQAEQSNVDIPTERHETTMTETEMGNTNEQVTERPTEQPLEESTYVSQEGSEVTADAENQNEDSSISEVKAVEEENSKTLLTEDITTEEQGTDDYSEIGTTQEILDIIRSETDRNNEEVTATSNYDIEERNNVQANVDNDNQIAQDLRSEQPEENLASVTESQEQVTSENNGEEYANAQQYATTYVQDAADLRTIPDQTTQQSDEEDGGIEVFFVEVVTEGRRTPTVQTNQDNTTGTESVPAEETTVNLIPEEGMLNDGISGDTTEEHTNADEQTTAEEHDQSLSKRNPIDGSEQFHQGEQVQELSDAEDTLAFRNQQVPSTEQMTSTQDETMFSTPSETELTEKSNILSGEPQDYSTSDDNLDVYTTEETRNEATYSDDGKEQTTVENNQLGEENVQFRLNQNNNDQTEESMEITTVNVRTDVPEDILNQRGEFENAQTVEGSNNDYSTIRTGTDQDTENIYQITENEEKLYEPESRTENIFDGVTQEIGEKFENLTEGKDSYPINEDNSPVQEATLSSEASTVDAGVEHTSMESFTAKENPETTELPISDNTYPQYELREVNPTYNDKEEETDSISSVEGEGENYLKTESKTNGPEAEDTYTTTVSEMQSQNQIDNAQKSDNAENIKLTTTISPGTDEYQTTSITNDETTIIDDKSGDQKIASIEQEEANVPELPISNLRLGQPSSEQVITQSDDTQIPHLPGTGLQESSDVVTLGNPANGEQTDLEDGTKTLIQRETDNDDVHQYTTIPPDQTDVQNEGIETTGYSENTSESISDAINLRVHERPELDLQERTQEIYQEESSATRTEEPEAEQEENKDYDSTTNTVIPYEERLTEVPGPNTEVITHGDRNSDSGTETTQQDLAPSEESETIEDRHVEESYNETSTIDEESKNTFPPEQEIDYTSTESTTDEPAITVYAIEIIPVKTKVSQEYVEENKGETVDLQNILQETVTDQRLDESEGPSSLPYDDSQNQPDESYTKIDETNVKDENGTPEPEVTTESDIEQKNDSEDSAMNIPSTSEIPKADNTEVNPLREVTEISSEKVVIEDDSVPTDPISQVTDQYSTIPEATSSEASSGNVPSEVELKATKEVLLDEEFLREQQIHRNPDANPGSDPDFQRTSKLQTRRRRSSPSETLIDRVVRYIQQAIYGV